jgi:hypothetical protein
VPGRSVREARLQRFFAVHRADQAPAVDQVKILAQAEFVAFDQHQRSCGRPDPDLQPGQRGQQTDAVLRRRFLADADAAAVLLPVSAAGRASGRLLRDPAC